MAIRCPRAKTVVKRIINRHHISYHNHSTRIVDLIINPNESILDTPSPHSIRFNRRPIITTLETPRWIRIAHEL